MNNREIKWKDLESIVCNHHFLLPSPHIRALIIGESGCGKTNLLFRLLLMKGWLDYDRLCVFGKSLHQPEYKLLRAASDRHYGKNAILKLIDKNEGEIDEFIAKLRRAKTAPTLSVEYFENSDDVPDPGEIDRRDKNLFVFDDIMTERNQEKVEAFYTRGRHNNVSSIYIAQNYFKLPRQTVRSNSNLIILFPLAEKDVDNIHRDLVSRDMDRDEFMEFLRTAWKEPYGYATINKVSSVREGKYTANLNFIYVTKNESS